MPLVGKGRQTTRIPIVIELAKLNLKSKKLLHLVFLQDMLYNI